MQTMEVAQALVNLCREGRNLEAIETLYADDITSTEVMEPMRVVQGRDGVIGKANWWEGAHEVHGGNVEGPWPNGDQFIVRFQFDITHKESGKRMQMDEVALYTVRDGKIVDEKFFYTT
jgi:ketosteroid isomerase-like protein